MYLNKTTEFSQELNSYTLYIGEKCADCTLFFVVLLHLNVAPSPSEQA